MDRELAAAHIKSLVQKFEANKFMSNMNIVKMKTG
jgi:hypothetical protein